MEWNRRHVGFAPDGIHSHPSRFEFAPSGTAESYAGPGECPIQKKKQPPFSGRLLPLPSYSDYARCQSVGAAVWLTWNSTMPLIARISEPAVAVSPLAALFVAAPAPKWWSFTSIDCT